MRAAAGRPAVRPVNPLGPLAPLGDQQDATVLDVRHEHVAVREHERVVGVPQLVGPLTVGPRSAVPPDDAPGRRVNQRDREVLFMGDDDLLAVRRVEGIVRRLESLAGAEVAGLGERPEDTPLRIHEHDPIIAFVGDEDGPRQDRRVRAGLEMPLLLRHGRNDTEQEPDHGDNPQSQCGSHSFRLSPVVHSTR